MKNLIKLREKKGLSQKYMAKMLNVSDVTYGNYERGTREPNNETLFKLADFYGVSIDYILGRETDPIFEKINRLDEEQKEIAKKALSEALPDIFSLVPDDDEGYVEGVGFTSIEKAKAYIEKYEAEVLDKNIKISDKEIFAMAEAIHTINKIKKSKM